MINKPVSFVFEPTLLEIHYEKSLKLQIVIFRFSSEEVKGGKRAVKMDKTEPMKFTNPQIPILITKSLNLLTTIPYNSEKREYESKEVQFQMALQIDGKKERMARKINLKDIIMSREINHKFQMENPLLVLNFKAQAILQQDQNSRVLQEKQATQVKSTKKIIAEQEQSKSTKRIKKEDNPPKSTKQLKIEEQLPIKIEVRKSTGRKQQESARADKSKFKTVNFGTIKEDVGNDFYNQEKQAAIRKSKSATRIQSSSSKDIQKHRTSIDKFQQSSKLESACKQKCDDIQEKYNNLLKIHKQLCQKYSETEYKMNQQENTIAELQQKLKSADKIVKTVKEQLKKEQTARGNCESKIKRLLQQIEEYKNQALIQSKDTNLLPKSSKNIPVDSQSQLRTVRQKLRKLQLKYSEQDKELQDFETQIRDKDTEISELKAKIYQLDRQNLELQSQFKNLQDKLAREKTEHESDLRQLTDQITQMKQQNRTLKKIPSSKNIKEDSGDAKKKIQTMEKQLQIKQQLLKKLSQAKKQSDNLNSVLRKEIEALKEVSMKPQKKEEGEIPIEMKIQLQKMKRQLQTCRKNQRTILVEKNRLQTANQSHQQDIVRIKLSIANILNAIQQTGNEKLISQVYGLTQ